MRNALAFLAGALFGGGLYLSGMTDTAKVQGWLDVFGDWDPTLAFVMGGAMIPMAIAWQVSARRAAPLAGGSFPVPPKAEVGRKLVIGSVLFGMGWGLVGLCPGPVIASLGYGDPGVWIFAAAMLVGMGAAPALSRRLDSAVPAE
ncbi:hypothetical protein SAMN05421853_10513 [Roseivivax halotolerans]|uniref:Sulphur transport domain-containing protein n=1 Tax=Roseivivax halotolerans TaxID=93684 RepID=A0A1I5Y799_9RHOB|nr:DUF6691 family protein [Roseivivax halotolerans]SFQ39797.1 hypothetical protein SAMN05421853_10513 [Roseivivax halotolerans]